MIQFVVYFQKLHENYKILYYSLLKMDNQEHGFPIEEEIIEEQYVEQQGIQVENESSQESQVDQLLPQPAFHIEEDHENLTQQEKDAFLYILSVRNQKQSIMKYSTKNVEVNYQNTTQETFIMKHKFLPQLENSQEQFFKKINEWRCESVQNWKLVVQNLVYLQKNTQKYEYFKEKLNHNMMHSTPQAYKLCLNKSLTLSQIEKYIVQFSNEKVDFQSNNQQKPQQKSNYHLWMYSLLAIHQSYASYTNFQALASINAVIQIDAKRFERKIKQNLLDNIKDEILKWLINLILLIDVFNQKFLNKYFKIVIKFNLI